MYGRFRRIHLVGIGGSGMSGIAEVLLNLGYRVSGSDLKESEALARLRGLGAAVHLGHDAANVEGADVVVQSTAIAESNPEVTRAHALGVPVIPRAEMLAELMRIKYSVAVAGAHGKTTTTSMVGDILARGDLDPTVIVGGRLKALGAHARLGGGPFLVAEADESDGSFLLLSPTVAVITNIDEEHLDFYGDLGTIRRAFVRFANRVPFYGAVVLPSDDANAAAIRSDLTRRVLTYGFHVDADFRGHGLTVDPSGVRFRLSAFGQDEGEIALSVAGVHNARNALAAAAAAWEIGASFGTIRSALHEFAGVARRLELKGEVRGATWIDDYAHHPTEIEAALHALRDRYGRRLVVAFQPHRYTRTQALLGRFAECFEGVASLVLLPIYAAGEAPIPGVTSEALAKAVEAARGPRAALASSHAEAARLVREALRPGDVLVTIGAGDVYRIGDLVKEEVIA
ncbi:MAG TPA: UDP-N-acetylmuramate--L-alanine ligase [Candidatus Eisenbacteria bacterium]|nr:UDP-N-acetylmuramate--L-alanine ligase [Candidatus Eisenbacteria bacterium]